MSRAIIAYPDGRTRAVKNLGWLLRHWKDVFSRPLQCEVVVDPPVTADERQGGLFCEGAWEAGEDAPGGGSEADSGAR